MQTTPPPVNPEFIKKIPKWVMPWNINPKYLLDSDTNVIYAPILTYAIYQRWTIDELQVALALANGSTIWQGQKPEKSNLQTQITYRRYSAEAPEPMDDTHLKHMSYQQELEHWKKRKPFPDSEEKFFEQLKKEQQKMVAILAKPTATNLPQKKLIKPTPPAGKPASKEVSPKKDNKAVPVTNALPAKKRRTKNKFPAIHREQFNNDDAETQKQKLHRINLHAILNDIPTIEIQKWIEKKRLETKLNVGITKYRFINAALRETWNKYGFPFINKLKRRHNPKIKKSIQLWITLNTIPETRRGFIKWKPIIPIYTGSSLQPCPKPNTLQKSHAKKKVIPDFKEEPTSLPGPVVREEKHYVEPIQKTILEPITPVTSVVEEPVKSRDFLGRWTIKTLTETKNGSTRVDRITTATGKAWEIRWNHRIYIIQRKIVEKIETPAKTDTPFDPEPWMLEAIRNATPNEKYLAAFPLLLHCQAKKWELLQISNILIPLIDPTLDPTSQAALTLTQQGIDAVQQQPAG